MTTDTKSENQKTSRAIASRHIAKGVTAMVLHRACISALCLQHERFRANACTPILALLGIVVVQSRPVALLVLEDSECEATYSPKIHCFVDASDEHPNQQSPLPNAYSMSPRLAGALPQFDRGVLRKSLACPQRSFLGSVGLISSCAAARPSVLPQSLGTANVPFCKILLEIQTFLIV